MTLRELIVDTDRGDGLLPVRRAIARCNRCPWMATMTGDTDNELADFLEALLLAHVAERHPRP